MRTTLVGIIATLGLLTTANAQVPKTLTYQATLSDTNGVALEDGTYEITFSIYPSTTSITPLWVEAHPSIATSNSVMTVVLGSIAPIGIDFDDPRYLAISVDGNGEMTPRIELTAVPSARTAATVEAGGVRTASLADSSVTSAKIADGSVQAADLAGGQVVKSVNGLTDAVTFAAGSNVTITSSGSTVTVASSSDLADLSVTNGKIAGNAVTSTKISDGSIQAGDLATGQVVKSVNGLTDAVTLTAGANVTITSSGSTVTITSSGGGGGGGSTVSSSDIVDGAVTSVDILDGTITAADIAAGVLSSSIAAGAVTTTEIADGTITATDMGTGAVTTTQIADGTIAAVDLAASAVSTSEILDGTIAAADLATGSVTTTEIADGTVASADIADGTIAAVDLAAGAVTTTEILDGTIATADLATSAVTTTQIADGTVATADLAANAVTAAQITDATITAADIGASQVVKSVNTLTDAITFAAGANVTITPSGQTLTIAASSSAANTLDQAYDQGGAGVGRTITADNGAVDIAGADGLTVNGKIGIGTTTPAEKLHIMGGILVEGSTASFAQRGLHIDIETSDPAHTLTRVVVGETGSNHGSMSLQTTNSGGTGEVVRLTNTGSVGIGTATPAEKLHVYGNVRLDNAGNDNTISGGVGGIGSINFRDNGTGGMSFDHTERYIFNIGGVEKVRILDDGHVGIGTAAPAALLTLNQAVGTDVGGMRLVDGAVTWSMYGDAGGDFHLKGGGTATGEIVIDSGTGNVGIGAASPGQLLSVHNPGTAGSAYPLRLINDISAAANTGVGIEFGFQNGTQILSNIESIHIGDSTTDLLFRTQKTGGLAEIARITGDGNFDFAGNTNVVIGRTVAQNPTPTSLTIRSNIANTGASPNSGAHLVLYSGFNAGGNYGQIEYNTQSGGAAGADAGAHIFSTGTTSLAEAMRIDLTGKVGIGTATPPALFSVEEGSINLNHSNTPFMRFQRAGAEHGYVGNANALFVGSTADFGIRAENNLIFGISSSEFMRLSSGGKFGIGEASPVRRLHVTDASAAVAAFNRTTDDGPIISLQQDGVEEGTISVSTTTVSYNAFTGSHYAWTDREIEMATLVTLSGDNHRLHGTTDSEIIYGITPSNKANDPAILGAYLQLQESTEPASNDNPHLVMAVGNGLMWVADNGDDIQVGDFLISADLAGHAMKDPGTYETSYIVARAAEPVSWSDVEDFVVDSRAKGLKHRKISVFFESFTRHNSAQEIASLKAENVQLRAQLSALATAVDRLAGQIALTASQTQNLASRD